MVFLFLYRFPFTLLFLFRFRFRFRGLFLESSRPGKLFCVCRIYIQDQSFNNFDNDTMKLSVNEAKLTGL